MKLLTARQNTTTILLRVHLDESKTIKDPTLPESEPDTRPDVPDPAWVWEATWGLTPPQGRTAAQYRADILREGKALALIELTNRQAVLADKATLGTALPGEGQAF